MTFASVLVQETGSGLRYEIQRSVRGAGNSAVKRAIRKAKETAARCRVRVLGTPKVYRTED